MSTLFKQLQSTTFADVLNEAMASNPFFVIEQIESSLSKKADAYIKVTTMSDPWDIDAPVAAARSAAYNELYDKLGNLRNEIRKHATVAQF